MNKGVIPNNDTIADTVNQGERGYGDHDPEDEGDATEADGDLKRDFREEKLMHTVIQADSDGIDEGRTVREAANHNVGAFTPDVAFNKIVNNYREAERLMGDTMIRELTGYDSDYIERNANIPEFQRELKDQIKQNVDELQRENIIDDDYNVTAHGNKVAAFHLILEELDELEGNGWIGDKASNQRFHTGEVQGFKPYASSQPYQDISTRRTVKVAARRARENIRPADLRLQERRSEGNAEIIFCVDVSGSMTGAKLSAAKKAAVALSYKAGVSKDDVGVVFFANGVRSVAPLGSDLDRVAEELVGVKPGGETDLGRGLEKALSMLGSSSGDQHVFLLTDALQTKGEVPEQAVLPVVDRATRRSIDITLLGLNLDDNGVRLAETIIDRSDGDLYRVENAEDTDRVVIEAYETT